MGSDAESEGMARRIIYENSYMTIGGRTAEYEYTDLHGSHPDPWRDLVEAETDNNADITDQR